MRMVVVLLAAGSFHVVGGNGRLIEAFEKALAGHTTLRAKVLGIDRRRDAAGQWSVTVRYLRDGQVKELRARRVVLAMPWMMQHLIGRRSAAANTRWCI